MERNETRKTPSRARRGETTTERLDPLLWLNMSFTSTGYDALKNYRAHLSMESGRAAPTLGQSLDALIKSHPFFTGAKVSP